MGEKSKTNTKTVRPIDPGQTGLLVVSEIPCRVEEVVYYQWIYCLVIILQSDGCIFMLYLFTTVNVPSVFCGAVLANVSHAVAIDPKSEMTCLRSLVVSYAAEKELFLTSTNLVVMCNYSIHSNILHPALRK